MLQTTFTKIQNYLEHDFHIYPTSELFYKHLAIQVRKVLECIKNNPQVLEEATEQGFKFSQDTLAKMAIAYKNRGRLAQVLAKAGTEQELKAKFAKTLKRGAGFHAVSLLHTVASMTVWNLDGAAAMHEQLTNSGTKSFKQMVAKARKI